MLNEVDEKREEHSINLIKKVLIGLGAIFILVGIIRQWPIWGRRVPCPDARTYHDCTGSICKATNRPAKRI